ncbi:MAG: glycosyltransferase, partial [Bifidobacterium crudilactis]|nr:glycosyltransferase [Bifidobacterium crudilactis]
MCANRPLVSVIVPVYNSERYLSHCLDSIRAQ